MKILSLIAMLMYLFLSVSPVFSEEDWVSWSKGRLEEVNKISKKEAELRRLKTTAECNLLMENLRVKWESSGPSKKLLPTVYAAKMCFRKIDYWGESWYSLNELEKALETLED